jgi:hypothetical protein
MEIRSQKERKTTIPLNSSNEGNGPFWVCAGQYKAGDD